MTELNLPQQASVNRFIAKSKIYEKATLNAKLQREFIDKINKITWKYKLAEATIGTPATEAVTEIQVFELELKTRTIPKSVLRVIDSAIPYPILYRFVHEQSIAYGITLKQEGSIESHYISDWDADIQFDFAAMDMERLYWQLIKAFVRPAAQSAGSFREIIDTDKKLKQMESEIASLEAKLHKEKQFNKQVEINKELRIKKNILARAESKP